MNVKTTPSLAKNKYSRPRIDVKNKEMPAKEAIQPNHRCERPRNRPKDDRLLEIACHKKYSVLSSTAEAKVHPHEIERLTDDLGCPRIRFLFGIKPVDTIFEFDKS